MKLSEIEKKEIIQKAVEVIREDVRKSDLDLFNIDKEKIVEYSTNKIVESILCDEDLSIKLGLDKENWSGELVRIKELVVSAFEKAMHDNI